LCTSAPATKPRQELSQELTAAYTFKYKFKCISPRLTRTRSLARKQRSPALGVRFKVLGCRPLAALTRRRGPQASSTRPVDGIAVLCGDMRPAHIRSQQHWRRRQQQHSRQQHRLRRPHQRRCTRHYLPCPCPSRTHQRTRTHCPRCQRPATT